MVLTAEPSHAPASKLLFFFFFLHSLSFHCATMTFGTSILGVLISAAPFKMLVENPSEIYNFIPIYQILISQTKMTEAASRSSYNDQFSYKSTKS